MAESHDKHRSFTLDEQIEFWRGMVRDHRADVVARGDRFGEGTAMAEAILETLQRAKSAEPVEPLVQAGPLKLDTDSRVFFYEQDHYYLSNFSAFEVIWGGRYFSTSEHAYQHEKFPHLPDVQHHIRSSRSAHDAFKVAEANKDHVRTDWPLVKVDIMREILRAKVRQHEYVRRKLLQTGDRELIENSWRDSFWGWGEDRRGQNMLGKLWMEIRAELQQASSATGLNSEACEALVGDMKKDETR